MSANSGVMSSRLLRLECPVAALDGRRIDVERHDPIPEVGGLTAVAPGVGAEVPGALAAGRLERDLDGRDLGRGGFVVVAVVVGVFGPGRARGLPGKTGHGVPQALDQRGQALG